MEAWLKLEHWDQILVSGFCCQKNLALGEKGCVHLGGVKVGVKFVAQGCILSC